MGKIKIGLICYQTSSISKADHFDLKLENAVKAFVSECKKKIAFNCVYILKRRLNREKYFMEVQL